MAPSLPAAALQKHWWQQQTKLALGWMEPVLREQEKPLAPLKGSGPPAHFLRTVTPVLPRIKARGLGPRKNIREDGWTHSQCYLIGGKGCQMRSPWCPTASPASRLLAGTAHQEHLPLKGPLALGRLTCWEAATRGMPMTFSTLDMWAQIVKDSLQSNWEGTYKDALRTIRSKLMEVITFNSAMNNFFIYVLLKKNCKCNVKTHSHTYSTVIFLCSSLTYTTHLNSFLSGVYKKKKESKTHPPGRKGFFLCI